MLQHLSNQRIVAPAYKSLQDMVGRVVIGERNRITQLLAQTLTPLVQERLDRLLHTEGSLLAGSTPLAQWREAGRWPECFDRLWQALNTRHGRLEGTKQMIELLSYGSREGWERLRSAVEEALSLGCQDVAAIRHLMVAGRLTRPSVAAIEIGALARYERPQPVLSDYDQLLGKAVAA